MEWLFIIAAGIGLWYWFSSSNSNKKAVATYNGQGKPRTEYRKERKSQKKLLIEKPEIEVTEEIKEILDLLENTNKNIFLTGKAGTGKSTLLRYFRATTKKQHAVVAPTGVAALNVQGQTIHSFLKFGIHITPETVRRLEFHDMQVLRNIQVLIIDEISMVRADLLDCVDQALRKNRGKNEPFGGVQVVAIGDLYQLPPVLKGEDEAAFYRKYTTPYFFSARVFNSANFITKELHTVFRQREHDFIAVLNAIREGTVSENQLSEINACVRDIEDTEHKEVVHLVPTRAAADSINTGRLNQLTTPQVEYHGSASGGYTRVLEKDLPTNMELRLKVGAQAMLLNNDRGGRWVNGDVVKVIETKDASAVVEFEDKSCAEIASFTWEKVRFVFNEEEQRVIPEVVGQFTQLPIKLAWALTIHKAQGKTLKKVNIDMGRGAFACGQTYVALSRCESKDGLYLRAPILIDDVKVDPRIKEFMRKALSQN